MINCSITKLRDGLTQQMEPTMGSAVAHAIGADQAMTFDLSNACAGMLTGVTVANNRIRQGNIDASGSAGSTSRNSATMQAGISATS